MAKDRYYVEQYGDWVVNGIIGGTELSRDSVPPTDYLGREIFPGDIVSCNVGGFVSSPNIGVVVKAAQTIVRTQHSEKRDNRISEKISDSVRIQFGLTTKDRKTYTNETFRMIVLPPDILSRVDERFGWLHELSLNLKG